MQKPQVNHIMSAQDYDQEVIHSALAQVDQIMSDLTGGPQGTRGYYNGYELGYAKGVLEHLLRSCRDLHHREAYVKGYINGYAQGILYTLRQRATDGAEKIVADPDDSGSCSKLQDIELGDFLETENYTVTENEPRQNGSNSLEVRGTGCELEKRNT